jgi:hypothetical protein
MESPPFKRLTGPIGKSKEFRQTFLRRRIFKDLRCGPCALADRNLDPASSTLPAPPEHHRPQNTRRKTLVTTSSQNRNAAPRLQPGRIAQFETALCQGTSLLVPIGVSLKIAEPASAGDTSFAFPLVRNPRMSGAPGTNQGGHEVLKGRVGREKFRASPVSVTCSL